MSSSLPSTALRPARAFVEACASERARVFSETLFPLHMAVLYRAVFMSEVWRVNVLPLVCEKERWLNRHSDSNNETVEMQMQALPVDGALPAAEQRALVRAHRARLAEDPEAFVRAWAERLRDWCEGRAAVLHERNQHPSDYFAVRTDHMQVVRLAPGPAAEAEPLEEDTRLTFPGYRMPLPDGAVRFPTLFYLRPAGAAAGDAPPECAMRARFAVTRARENACFHVVSNAFWTRDRDSGQLRFRWWPFSGLYSDSFLWVAASAVVLMRLRGLLEAFEARRLAFAPSTEIVPGPRAAGDGSAAAALADTVFEFTLAAGALARPWERDFLAARDARFADTGGLPLAMEKRAISDGYVDGSFAPFLCEHILAREYGRRISRLTYFDHFDDEKTVVRLQFLPRAPEAAPPCAADADRFFCEGTRAALRDVERFVSSCLAADLRE